MTPSQRSCRRRRLRECDFGPSAGSHKDAGIKPGIFLGAVKNVEFLTAPAFYIFLYPEVFDLIGYLFPQYVHYAEGHDGKSDAEHEPAEHVCGVVNEEIQS